MRAATFGRPTPVTRLILHLSTYPGQSPSRGPTRTGR